MSIDKKIADDLIANDIRFITTVPCKQLAGVIEEIEARPEIHHIPANKEDEGMGLCAGGGEWNKLEWVDCACLEWAVRKPCNCWGAALGVIGGDCIETEHGRLE